MNEVDIWESLGSLEETEAALVLNQMFTLYEQQGKHDPGNVESKKFFTYLASCIGQVQSCNVNRR